MLPVINKYQPTGEHLSLSFSHNKQIPSLIETIVLKALSFIQNCLMEASAKHKLSSGQIKPGRNILKKPVGTLALETARNRMFGGGLVPILASAGIRSPGEHCQ
ncbi:MAG: hypothetical protein WKF89_07980 [Chitinophagaceae bacterium]